MPTKNVVITQHQSEMIESLVESGRYQNASEVLREGLRLIEERDALREARVKSFHDAIGVGLDDLDAGRYVELNGEDLEQFIAGLGRPGRRAR